MVIQKKGQAAMEFLMTYGWAILAAIVAIGALAYFGVFSPGNLITGNAIVSTPFYLDEWNIISSLGTDGGVNLELLNGFEDYEISNVDVSGCGAFTPVTPQLVQANSLASFQILCSPGVGLVTDNVFKGDIRITYRKVGSQLDLVSTGSISDRIQE